MRTLMGFGMIIGLLVVTLAQPTPAEDMKALRKQAAHRHRRIIFDNDGNEPVYYCDTVTKKALLDRRTTALAGSQVDTIMYCTWSSGFSMFTHNTKIGQIFTCTAQEPGKGPGSGFSNNKTAQFLAKGMDPLAIMVEWCKAHQVEVFWSMRMNDVHDAWGAWYSPFLFPRLKKEHPEWLMGTKEKRPVNGTWTAVDYGRPEIRDLAFKFFQEVCQHYDVNGIEMDFFRHLSYFRNPAWGKPATQAEWDMMTGLLQRVRAMADEEAVKKGHPILISVRVPDSVALCKAIGFDIERWMRDDLIDILVVSGYFRLNPWETSVALAHKYDVPVYACLSETRMRDKKAAEVRSSLACYRGRAMNAWDAGMDGIYMFNFFNPHSPLWHELGSPDTLAPLAKCYTTGARGDNELDYWWEGGEKFLNRNLLDPAHPRTLEPGTPVSVELRVGEKPVNRTVTLRLRWKTPVSGTKAAVYINGNGLSPGKTEDVWTYYAVKPEWVRRGMNRIRATLPPSSSEETVLLDCVLDVGPLQEK